jgi:hypothetical protein
LKWVLLDNWTVFGTVYIRECLFRILPLLR